MCHETLIADVPHLQDPVILRYEDLVAAPDRVLEAAFRAASLEPHPSGLTVRSGINDAYFERWSGRRWNPRKRGDTDRALRPVRGACAPVRLQPVRAAPARRSGRAGHGAVARGVGVGGLMRRERGGRNDNYSRVPEPVADAAKAAFVGARMLNAGSRPLPDFLIIGAQRCGTTSLYRYLEKHPQVIGAAPSKGVHYFDVHHERSLRWYRAHFPTRRRRERVGRRAVTGEASPYYVFHPHGPDRVRAAVPNVRLILMLRDPVVRAFSQYQQEYARGFEDAETFERALELEQGRLAGERERMLADPGYDSRAMQHYAYVARGEYATAARGVARAVRPDQVHVIQAEEFFAEPARVLRPGARVPRPRHAGPPAPVQGATTPVRPGAWRPRRAPAWPSTSPSRTAGSRSSSAAGWGGSAPTGRRPMADEGVRGRARVPT